MRTESHEVRSNRDKGAQETDSKHFGSLGNVPVNVELLGMKGGVALPEP